MNQDSTHRLLSEGLLRVWSGFLFSSCLTFLSVLSIAYFKLTVNRVGKVRPFEVKAKMYVMSNLRAISYAPFRRFTIDWGYHTCITLISICGNLPLECCCPVLLRRDRQIRRPSPGSGDPGRAKQHRWWLAKANNTQEGDYPTCLGQNFLSCLKSKLVI